MGESGCKAQQVEGIRILLRGLCYHWTAGFYSQPYIFLVDMINI